MKVQISLYNRLEKSNRYPEIMQSSERTFYDFSKVDILDRTPCGDVALIKMSLSSLPNDPTSVVREAIRVYTTHSIYKASGFKMDYADNNYGLWSDVHWENSSIHAPLTNTQKIKLAQALPHIKTFWTELPLGACVTPEFGNRNGHLNTDFTDECLKKLDELWDISEDSQGLEMLLQNSLKALCQTVWDEQNKYLNIYYKENGPPHALCEMKAE
jgi:hypothetical protein